MAGVNLPDGASASTGGSTCFEVARDDPCLSAGGEEDGVFYSFPSPFQSEPADLMTPAFAGRRRSLLRGVFESIGRGDAVAMIRQAWSRHYGKACTGEECGYDSMTRRKLDTCMFFCGARSTHVSYFRSSRLHEEHDRRTIPCRPPRLYVLAHALVVIR